MTMLAFRTRALVYPEETVPAANLRARRERLALVSTGSKLCGVAAYAAALRRQLSEAFDVTVFDLDQYLLRSTHRRVRNLADKHVKDICKEIARFDAVNLQLEHGTLGQRAPDIYRRFCWLAAAAPRLSVTFHTLLTPPRFESGSLTKALLTLQWPTAERIYAGYSRHRLLSRGIARQLRRLQQAKQVSAIVHNRRDLYDAKYLYGISNVFDHPLAFLGNSEAVAIRSHASRHALPMLDSLPADTVLIGVFGFLNEYKGVGTAIEALRHLPANHHLLIFGGIHPNEITARQPLHPYISSLFRDAFIDMTIYDRISMPRGEGAPALVLGPDRSLSELLGAHPRDLSGRIHFMGALDDGQFLTGMAVCDAVVFPYLEVGQSASGPISQALELGCRIIASRTHTFLQFAEYHRDAIEFFDIGNHVELADRILARPQFAEPRKFPEFNAETNKAVYLLANSRLLPPGASASRLPIPEAAATR
jgi:glycosyltransferase involved in cell wall biosynthesis